MGLTPRPQGLGHLIVDGPYWLAATAHKPPEQLPQPPAEEASQLSAQGGEVIYSTHKSPASVITERLENFGKITLTDTILGRPFRYATEGFFQVNVPVYEQALRDMAMWVNSRVTLASGDARHITAPTVDLYSGVGTIGLTIGSPDTILVELNEHAVREMQRNIKELGSQATAVLAASEQALDYITSDQTITSSNCPTERTVVADARDNHTYFIQKLADGRCWMLTNLAYAGGTSNSGTNTYNDVIPTGNGTAGTLSNGTSDTATTYTEAKYYVHANASPTIHPNTPSTNNAGGGTVAGGERQYGYHYNCCAAMGAQSATGACVANYALAPNQNISVCPAGWRLPTGGSGAEFGQLTTAIGATNNTAGSITLRNTWLAQFGGYWTNEFSDQGSYGRYWSASQSSDTGAINLRFYSTIVSVSGSSTKSYGQSVRCLAI